MKASWPRVQFREFLRPNSRPYTLGQEEDANLVGMRLYGGGPFHRELKPAMQIAKKTHFIIKAGDIIYNKLFAWKGTFGVVPAAFDGMFVSDKFPTYELDRASVDERFLRWYFRCPPLWEEARAMSTGSAALSKLTLNPPKFLLLTMPVPPLGEQRRIVARIEEIAARIEEAKTLRRQISDGINAMRRAIITEDTGAKPTAMCDLVRLRPPNVTVRPSEIYQFAGVYCFGRGVFRAQAKSGMEFAYSRLSRLKVGDFVYPKLMAWEGAFGIVPPECDGCVVSTEFPVFEVLQDRVLPEVLETYFTDPAVWSKLSSVSTGTNVRRRRLNPQDFLDHVMPLPSQETQQRLRVIGHEADTLKRLEIESAVETDALLPAILDRAFKGEL